MSTNPNPPSMFIPGATIIYPAGVCAAAAPVMTQTFTLTPYASYPITKMFCPRCKGETVQTRHGVPGSLTYYCDCGWDCWQPADVAATGAPPEQPEAPTP